jgi:hypothetical protein
VAARRPPGHDCRWREGEKKEGGEGVLLPHSPWVGAARGDGFTGGGRPVVVVLRGGGALVLSQGEKVAVVMRGGWGAADPFYRWGKAVRPGIFRAREALMVQQWRWRGKISRR